MQRVHVLSAFVFCLCLATVNAQSNYKYNVNVYLSAEYFEPVDGDIELRFVKNDLFESFVTETKSVFVRDRICGLINVHRTKELIFSFFFSFFMIEQTSSGAEWNHIVHTRIGQSN